VTTTQGAAQRRDQVLAAALDVFATFGFRKTSMDAVAQAADISRPGLYFLFENKEVLFRETMRHAMDEAMDDARLALAQPDAGLAERLAAALDAWLGRHVGTHIGRGVDTLLEHSPAQLGTLYEEYRAAFLAILTEAIAADGRCPDRAAAAEVAELLHAAATGWKYQVRARQEFAGKIAGAARIVVG
jgi:TetR/AcrR family transcriptional regulator of autoinduction and epiphytic fitness